MKILQNATLAASATALTMLWNTPAFAQFGSQIPNIADTPDPGTGTGGVRSVIINVLNVVLSFLALLAVVFIIVAGIRLIVSGGNDEAKDKAKNTILYAVIGLIIVLLARVIVGFVVGIGQQL